MAPARFSFRSVIFCTAILTGLVASGAHSLAQTPPPAKTDKPKTEPAKPAPKPATPKTETPKDESPAAASSEEAGPSTAAEPALPIPRFVSFRQDPINLRTGPGVRYPVEWIYMRRRLPVEIIAEFETWRQIRDPDGTEGWVHQTMLSGRRTGFIKGAAQALRKANVDQADTIAMLEPGVVVDIQRCPADGPFCRVEINGLQGWLKRDQFWGVYPQEKIE